VAITIDTATTYQAIDGFGVDMAIPDSVASDSVADLLWSPTAGIGLTWCRLRASVVDGSLLTLPTGGASMVANAQKARDRGARFWALADGENTTPAGWLSGSLLASAHYADYAASFKKIVDAAAALGLTVEFVSVFNEPDIAQDYTYVNSGAMLHDIIAQAPVGTPPLIVGETALHHRLPTYADATLNDTATRARVGRCGTHVYDSTAITPYSLAVTHSIPIWQTEYNDVYRGGASDLQSALNVATRTHQCLADGNYSMMGFFLIAGFSPFQGTRYGILGDNYATTKRCYSFGNFSKFVRPGSTRIGATGAPAGVSVSAYIGSAGTRVIVAINANASATAIDVTGLTAVPSVTPWITDATRDLAAQSPIALSGGSFSASLPASSVTTFVGQMPVSLVGDTSAAASLAASQSGSYQPAARLTVAAGPVVGGKVTLSGHRLPGSVVTVTVG
jgi:glucuronoarabinoxylan endo-1,4-beta-xylanase